jgi:thermostable 8-oxoguanine DNA glycosylase
VTKNRDILDFMKKYGLYERENDHYIYLEIEEIVAFIAKKRLDELKSDLYDIYRSI